MCKNNITFFLTLCIKNNYGLYLDLSVSSFEFVNNLLSQNGIYGVYFAGAGNFGSARGNLLDNVDTTSTPVDNDCNTGTNATACAQVESALNKNIACNTTNYTTCNPKFVSGTSPFDFKILTASPAVDAGENVVGFDVLAPFNAPPLYKGGSYDIGAYESH